MTGALFAFATDSSIRLPSQKGRDFELVLFERGRTRSYPTMLVERSGRWARWRDTGLRPAIIRVKRR